jgi:hypothetical protein
VRGDGLGLRRAQGLGDRGQCSPSVPAEWLTRGAAGASAELTTNCGCGRCCGLYCAESRGREFLGQKQWQKQIPRPGNEEIYRLRPGRNSDEEERVKKIGFFSLLIMATLLLAIAFPAAASGPKAPAAPAAAAPAPAVAALPTPAPHPHIHEALEAMRNAKHELETAAHDFHGHRLESIKHLDMAIHEAELCEQEP